MKISVVLLSCSIFLLQANLNTASAITSSTIYVSPGGNDVNLGAEEKPVATIARARDLVRQLVTAGLKEDVQVLVHGGTYYLPETLTFDNRDSGTKDYSITYAAYPGEKVVLSGGRRITSWKQDGNNLWSIVIPEVTAGRWYFRELYIAGTRAVRARTPNANAKEPYYSMMSATLSDDHTIYEVKISGLPVQRTNWENPTDVEVVSKNCFEITRKQLTGVNTTNGTLLMAPLHTKHTPPIRSPIAGVVFLENALQFLDQPGEWYLNRSTGKLQYWPRDGVDMQKAEVIAPMLIRLLEVKGSVGQPVENLHFRNLTFAHAAWPLPPDGYLGFQACSFLPPDDWYGRMEAALSFQFAQACSLEDCEITHTGGHGVELRLGCTGNLLQGNQIYDISANGIMVGEGREGRDETNTGRLVRNNYVINNFIHDCGVSYFGAVGIWVGYTDNTLIAHNLVCDLPYTGISVGWNWDKRSTTCKNNRIEYNHVHHVMQIMNDGGAIYTLGYQPGTIIRGNVVHDTANRSQIFGLYLDQGSTGFLIESNVIYRVPTEPVWDVWASVLTDAHIWRGNTFTRTDPLVTGIVGDGAKFENGSYLEMPHTPALEPAALTVEAWVKFLTFPTGKDPCVWIVNKNTNELTNANYALAVSHNNVGAYLNIGGGRDNCFASWSNGNPVSSNGWNHLAMTYDGRDLRVYCNGILAGLTPVNRQRSTSSGDLRIGKRADNNGSGFHGVMDEIRIYNRALSDEEIATQYTHPSALGSQPSTTSSQLTADLRPLSASSSNLQSPISNHDSSLVAYWSFDDTHDKLQRVLKLAGPQEPYAGRFGLVPLTVR